MKSPFDLIIKPMTNISHIEMKNVKCACGCGKRFLKNVKSTQKYASLFCLEYRGSHVRNLAQVNKLRNANGLDDLKVVA